MILLAVIFMDFLTGMEFDLFVPSFPEIQTQFHLTPFWVEALLSANFIGYTLSLLQVGSLADRFGRKPIIMIGLIIFISGSVLCVMAKYYPLLLIGRFLQGSGIAAPSILSFLIIADRYPLKRQQFFMAMLNGSMNIAVAAAPVIGSYIALYFQWRGNFVLLLWLGILVLLVTVFFIPKNPVAKQSEIISVGSYLSILRSKPLMLLITNIVLMCVPYWIFVGMSPILYIKDFGVNLRLFGYYQGIYAFIFAFGSILFGFILHRYAQRKMLKIAGKIYILSFLILAAATFINTRHPLFITLAFMPFVISQIIPITLLYPLCLNFMSQAKAKISAVVQGARLVVTSFGVQIAGYFYIGDFKNIGIILLIFIMTVMITHFFILKNKVLLTTLNLTE